MPIRIIKLALSHISIFLGGMFATGFYYWAFVHPDLSNRLNQICDESKLAYFGDWVLDIFFPIIPLIAILGLALLTLQIIDKKQKRKH